MQTRPLLALAMVIAAALVTACGRPGGTIAAPEDARAVLKRYCVDCHNSAELAGELSFEKTDPASVAQHADVWERVLRKLTTRTMPPQDEPRPEAATYSAFSAWLEAELDRSAALNPGRPALRRLNRSEYANAIRDLLDFDVDVASLLPPDDSAFGFTALHWAARTADAPLVKQLLAAGANPKTGNRYGVTPLQLAAENGDATMLRTFLAAGADANAVPTRWRKS